MDLFSKQIFLLIVPEGIEILQGGRLPEGATTDEDKEFAVSDFRAVGYLKEQQPFNRTRRN